MRAFAVLLVLWCSQSSAYLGSFDPQPIRNVAEVTFYDEQIPGPRCLSLSQTAVDIALAPFTLQAAGCASYSLGVVVVPISFGPGWLYGMQVLATPNGNLGHETRHIFDGNFHPVLLSFIERVRHTPNYRVVSGEQSDRDVQDATERSGERFRLPATDETVCTIFTKSHDVSYEDFGALVRECLK